MILFCFGCQLRFSFSKKNGVVQLVSLQVCKGSGVTAEAHEKQQLKTMFCLLHTRNKGVLHCNTKRAACQNMLCSDKEEESKTFWQATRVQNTLARKETFETVVSSRQHFLKKDKEKSVEKLWQQFEKVFFSLKRS